jgi:hypothetical protein
LSYDKGDDAVYPPRQIPAEEEDIDKGRYGGAEKYGAPEQYLFPAFFCQRPHHAKEGVIEKRHADEINDQEDGGINAIVLDGLLRYFIEFRYDELQHRTLPPFRRWINKKGDGSRYSISVEYANRPPCLLEQPASL